MEAALIGVIGTLLGTILGWGLNNVSRWGKLSCYPIWSDEFSHNDNYGSMARSSNREEAKMYGYNIKLDLYNNSGEPKIMRKLEVVFYQDKRELFRDTPKDDSTCRNSGGLRFYDEILPITVLAKTVSTLKLHGGFWYSEDRFSKLWDANSIFLTYRNEQNREKKVLLKRNDFSRYFENQPVKDN